MEAQGRRFGTIFPGYNGPTLPRAIRSSRGKGELSKRQTNCGERPRFFELLATVAGQFLQDDEVVEENNNIIGHETSTNEVNPLTMNTKALQNMHVIMEQSSKDSTGISFAPPNIENIPFHKQKDGIEQVQIHNCAKLSRCNSFMLHELPIPSFIKNIMMDESLFQQNVSSSSENDHLYKLDMEFKDAMLMEHDSVLKFTNETSSFMENKDHVFTKDLQLKDSNGNDIAMCLNQTKIVKTVNASEQIFTLNQSHDSICESCNLFHNLGTNVKIYKALNGLIETNISNNVLFSKLDATFGAFFSEKTNIEHIDNYTTSVDLKTVDQDENLRGVETIIPNQTNLDCPNHYVSTNLLESMSYINSKQRQGDHDATKEETIIQKHSKFDEKDNIKGHRSSQCQLHEAMTKKLLEAETNGLRPCRTITNCNNVLELKAKSKEDGTKPIENIPPIPTKQTFFNGIAAFTRQRTSRRLPLKRKRLEDGDTPSSNLHVKTKNPMDIGYDGVYGEPPAAAAKLRSAKAASVSSSPTAKGSTKSSTKNFVGPHVKFGIKSFIVPEFFVDLPESASILTLKRAVMDAAMNLFGEGLRVHVLMHGKKVIDEGATLSQTGISRSLKPESLGFMLEPSPISTSSTTTFEDPFLVLSRPVNQTSPRFQAFGVSNYSHCQEMEVGSQGITFSKGNSSTVIEGCSLHNEDTPFSQSLTCGIDQQASYVGRKRSATTISFPTSVHDDKLKGNNINVGKTTTTKSNLTERIALSPHSTRIAAVGALAAIRAQADANRRLKSDIDTQLLSNNHTLHDGSGGASGAIILHTSIGTRDNMHGLALVSMQQKSRSFDIGKRRVRRPFSVAEVEALVHAVEKLGTGRWRDVKLRAFEQAKHRTYVDLKDKWKTLVHTARIAPHQRRGEPVPQELLERVTRAHTYWTAQAAKQQAELGF